jgi:hypothetical protein
MLYFTICCYLKFKKNNFKKKYIDENFKSRSIIIFNQID